LRWRKYFAEKPPHPSQIRSLVLRLLDQKKYEDVIAVIEAALINGQAQPWMYEALASTMKAAGRPEKDIQRVLLSSVDFSATDVPDLLFAAAYLTRFGQNQRALELYREASRFAPQRPEPYVLGLKLTRAAKDPDGVAWAAAGILTQVWTRDHVQLHRQAEEAVAEAEGWLNRPEHAIQLKALQTKMQAARRRDLSIRLCWNGDADLDLIVEEPLGTTCSFETRQSRGGGVFVHDGKGPRPEAAYELYVCPEGAPGTYRVTIRVLSGKVVAKQALLTITRQQGTAQESQEKMAVTLTGQDTLVTVKLDQGRRKELLPPIAAEQASREDTTRNNRIQQVGHLDGPASNSRLVPALEQAALRNRFENSRSVLYQQLAAAGVRSEPVIRFVQSGTNQAATAVVSPDRRYVRLSLSPTFSAVTDVFTFTYSGGGN